MGDGQSTALSSDDIAIFRQVTSAGGDGMRRFDGRVEDGARNPAIVGAQFVEKILDLPNRQLRQHADDLPFGQPHVMAETRHFLPKGWPTARQTA
jgi:hypothetical protein